MQNRKWLVLGATSFIAVSCMRRMLKAGDTLCLVARDEGELTNVAADLRVRTGAQVITRSNDLTVSQDTAAFVNEIAAQMGGLDSVLVATGELGDQTHARQNIDWHNNIITTNFTGICQFLHPIANMFEAQKQGLIIVLSSVAGDRGRQSNYIYGAAKAGINAYLQGLRNRLHKVGARVLTVKLGYTDTRMIYNTTHSALTASPEFVAQSIHDAITRGRDVIYIPVFWMGIMTIIRAIPEFIFKKLPL